MDFLKNYYEKIILSVTLVLVTAGAVWLALQAVGVRNEVKGLKDLAIPVVNPGTNSVIPTYDEALTNGRAPQSVDFDGSDHKIFNPEKILERTMDRVKFPFDALGAKALEIREIRPLPLKIRIEQRTVRDRTSISAYVTPAYEAGRTGQERKASAREGKSIRFGAGVTQFRRITVDVVKIHMDPKDPAAAYMDIDFSMGGGVPERIRIMSGKEGWSRHITYEADMYYSPNKREYPSTRVGHRFMFGADTNTVIQVTEEDVTVRQSSNQKRVTIKKSSTP
jgi:hypothetical protein